MSGLVQYASSDEEGEGGGPVVSAPPASMQVVAINAAPAVQARFGADVRRQLAHNTKEIMYNPTAAELFAPELGPDLPNHKKKLTKNTFTGFVEAGEMSEFQFEDQRRTYSSFGYAHDPSVHQVTSVQTYVGDQAKALAMQGTTHASSRKRADKRKRKAKGNPADVDSYLGPWAAYEGEAEVAKPSEEQQAILETYREYKEALEKAEKEGSDQVEEVQLASVARKKAKTKGEESSVLHIDDPVDYQGRSYLHPPYVEGVKYEPPTTCHLPKKRIHTWSGHTKAVAAIKFFPVSAHLLLSAGMDNKIKLWEVYNKRRVVRTFHGHTAACRDIDFSKHGKTFVSCGYDKMVRHWDTETGQCIRKFAHKKIPYCIKFHPKQTNNFVVGGADKKILCYDTRSGDVTQTYDRHLGAVNTVTFVENGDRMVSTSDDKSIRVWEWGIPVDMKYIADPKMHAIPAICIHPNDKWMLCQGMNNEITVYQAHDKFRQNSKKKFKGHQVAGYACQVSCSPDGHYVISGDSEGKCHIWDWRSCKRYESFFAHDSVCMGALWNPNRKSEIATCGWDGTIKYWH